MIEAGVAAAACKALGSAAGLFGMGSWWKRNRDIKKRAKELAEYIARVQKDYPDPEEAEKITRLTSIDGGKRK